MNISRKDRYCWNSLVINLVFVAKGRSARLTSAQQTYLEASRNFGADLTHFESDATYICFKLNCGPITPGAADLVRSLKSMTSRSLRKNLWMLGIFLGTGFMWLPAKERLRGLMWLRFLMSTLCLISVESPVLARFVRRAP